jgi:hypothetical protein
MDTLFETQNPWRNPSYRFPAEKEIPRRLLPELLAQLEKPEIAIILGSRQVGKTFIMQRLIRELLENRQVAPEQVFYFNMDAVPFRELVGDIPKFLRFVETRSEGKSPAYIFLDEVQRVNDAGLLLKQYHDLKRPLKLVVSGSSSLEIKSQVKESLVGRKRLFQLFPASFDEYCAYHGHSLAKLTPQHLEFESDRFLELFEDYLLHGGYPKVILANGTAAKRRELQEIYSSYVEKDISDFLKVEDIPGFNRVVQQMAVASGNLLNLHEITKVARVSRYYAETFLQMLRDTYVVDLLHPYSANVGKALVKTPKLYFWDTGLRNAVFGQFQPLHLRTDAGALAETYAFSQLAQHLDPNRLWFWRTRNQSEVDFLYQQFDGVLLAEVKFQEQSGQTRPKAFFSLQSQLKVKQAIVLTKRLWEEKSGDVPILFFPVWLASRLTEFVDLRES